MKFRNSWLTALVAWGLATILAAGGFSLWQLWQGEPMRWDIFRDAALLAMPVAFVLGWRDRNR